ncbi:MAG: amino acid adenylation domain-containing protein, partial [Mycobacteriales bacterium]
PVPRIARRADPTAPAPLSAAQARLWFLAQLDPDSVAYLLPSVTRLRGDLDRTSMLAAVSDVLERHEVLRSRIVDGGIDADPVSVVGPVGDVPVSTVDVDETALQEAITADLARPFDLAATPPTRVALYRLAADHHVLAVTFHHVAIDDWSLARLLGDLAGCYAARRAGSPLPPAPQVQHADVAMWESQQAADPAAADDERWWADRLAGAPPLIELPVDHHRPAVADWSGRTVDLEVPAPLADAVRSVAAEHGATPFMVFLTAWTALLSRLSGTADTVVGVPEAGRAHAGTEDVVGCFINTLPMRTEVAPHLTGRDLLARVRDTALDAFGHAGVSFDRIVERVAPGRDRSTTPVFQVLLNVLDATDTGPAFAGLTATPLDQPITTAKYDLNLALAAGGGGYLGGLTYRTDLFERSTVERMTQWYLRQLSGIVADLDRPVAAVALEETDGPLVRGAHLTVDSSRRLHETVEHWAAQTPDATAVVASDGELTYAELDRRANQVAHRLLAGGVAPDEPVALLVDRTTHFPVGALGILKAGGAYLPVDPIFPDERVLGMLESVGVRVVLAAGALVDRVARSNCEVLVLDDPTTFAGRPDRSPGVDVDPAQVAYVIFTSGSTGRPKGVGVEHRNITAYIAAAMAKAADPLDGVDRRSFALVATIAADSGMTTVWGCLGTGSTLHLLDRDVATDPAAYARYFAGHHIDVVKMVPSLLELLATYGDLPAVLPRRLLILGGEALSFDLANRVAAARPHLTLQNHYGPTEATVSVLVCDTDEASYPAGARVGMVPLGVPFAGVDVYIVDEGGRALPRGVAGELWIGGPLVARGYLGQPELTAQRFSPDPIEGTTRCYHTGDRARVTADGRVIFLGRVDDQVKVRGYRVELGEVTTALRGCDRVSDAVVLPVGENHNRRLAAWVVPPAGETVSVSALRAALRTTLPDYMVPTSITVLDAFVLNPNGKVDRAALPAPVDTVGTAERVDPGTPMQLLVAAAWRDVLGVDDVSAGDDFFAAGGHSFAATRLIARLRHEIGRPIAVRAIFDHPVLAELAAALDGAAAGDIGRRLTPRADPADRAPLSPAQARLWFLAQLDPDSPAYNVPVMLKLIGPVDGEALLAAVRDLAERHQVLRSTVVETDGVPQLVVGPLDSVPITRSDALPERLDGVLRAEADRAFALDAEPPLRATLIRVGGDEHVLALTLHHIATDAWSRTLITRELAALYAARIGLTAALPDVQLQYADYAAWLAEHDEDDAGLDWWADRLAGLEPVLELPTDRARPTVATWTGGEVPIDLPGDLTESVRRAARTIGGTPFMVLLAAWQELLSRLSGEADIAVGVPESGRHHGGTDTIVGCFVNTLVMRTDVSGPLTGRELLRRVRDTALGAYAHADVPFERVVNRLHPQRSLTATPIFQVALNVVDAGSTGPAFPGVDVTPVDPASDLVKFDLDLGFVDDGTALRGGLTFRGELFDYRSVQRFAHWYQTLLAGILADLDAPVAGVALAPVDGPLLCGPATTVTPALIHTAAERHARETPDAPAVVGPDGTLTYAELDRRANRVANRLIADGVSVGDPVAVLVERSIHLAVALLGILKAGGAYVALDPAYPDERVEAMLRAADCRVVVTQAGLRTRIGSDRVCRVLDDEGSWLGAGTDPPARRIDDSSLAYVIFTSGSTGTPKGVAVEHRQFAHYLPAVLDRLGPGIADGACSFALVSTIAADLGLTNVWGALSTGGTLHLLDREAATDPAAPTAPFTEHRVDVVKMVPNQL